VRPGRATADSITRELERISWLGAIFLGALAAAPALVEGVTGLTAFRGFAGTSVLILVGVATDTARKVRAELAMQKYGDIDKLYDDN
jgi:protein transport protein SEC61 subunit alpha